MLNNGKGVEALEHISTHQDKYSLEVVHTGPLGVKKTSPAK